MQVTGSNNISSERASKSILSIQLVQGGLYFSVCSDSKKIEGSGKLSYQMPNGSNDSDKLLKLLNIIYGDNPFLNYQYRKVNLVVDTPRVTPVPRSWVDKDNYADWLTYAGFMPLSHECVVVSQNFEQMAMIMPLDKQCDEFFKDKHGEALNYVHPLEILCAHNTNKSFMAVSIKGSGAYVVAAEKEKIKFMMPLVFKGDAEAIFCLRKLSEEFSSQPQLFYATTQPTMAKVLEWQFKGAVNLNKTMGDIPLFNVNNCRL